MLQMLFKFRNSGEKINTFKICGSYGGEDVDVGLWVVKSCGLVGR
jgi:hypothetical protein